MNKRAFRLSEFSTILIAALALAACGGGGGSSGGVSNPPPPSTYTIGGSVTGLSGNGLVLQNNGGNDLTLAANGAFTFATSISSGGAYAVTIKTQPASPTQNCIVTSGAGTVSGANITNVSVSCTTVKPAAPTLTLTPQSIKTFHFSWTDVGDETGYRLMENADGVSGFAQVASLPADSTSYDLLVSLTKRINARYLLQACNSGGCTDSASIAVTGTLASAVGYFKASNTDPGDFLGLSIALSADGSTLAVGATGESSNATGINSNQADNSAVDSGAVYVFVRSAGVWTQQAYVKASNTNAGDSFGYSVALSADGNTLAVGAQTEDSNSTGINGNQADNSAIDSGAVYVFVRSGAAWTQQAYVKASNTDGSDWFGSSVALSGDGNILAVGAPEEASKATGINGNQADNSAFRSGAVYVYSRSGSTWSQQAYVKASNTEADDLFGVGIALSGDGNTLAVGASGESSNATGINGNQADNSVAQSGAVYVYVRNGGAWTQQAYVKASNTNALDAFGFSHEIALSADGNTLAVGAFGESSSTTGVNGVQSDNSAASSGAVYVYVRTAGAWTQQAYVKASNTNAGDDFGGSVALSADGDTLAVGATGESSNAVGINGNQNDNSTPTTGAVYVFKRSTGAWIQQAYVKAPNPNAGDWFGLNLALSADGATLAVSAGNEDGNARQINGDQINNAASNSGAVYLY